MDPAVVLCQDLTETADRYAMVRWQIWQRVTGSWVMVREAARKTPPMQATARPHG